MNRTRRTPADVGSRAISSIDADMRRAEAGRKKAIRFGVGLVIATVAAVLVLAVAVIDRAGASARRPATVKVASLAESTPPSTPRSAAPSAVAPSAKEAAPPATELAPETQTLWLAIGDAGYEPSALNAKAGVPIEITVERGEGCAAGFLIPELGVSADNSLGPVTVRLGALDPGSYQFSCGMEMVTGTLVVG